MKLYLRIFVVTVIVTGGIFMANHYGSSRDPGYKEYSSQDLELNIKMDYLSDWLFSEHRGSYGRYAQVQFYGTVKDDFAPSFVVTVERSSKVAFKPLTINAMANDVIKKRMNFKDARIVSRSEIELLAVPAIDITLTYQQPDKLRSIKAKLIPFKERIVMFQKGDRFYTVRYVNPEQEFEVFEQDFLHCLGTLSLKE